MGKDTQLQRLQILALVALVILLATSHTVGSVGVKLPSHPRRSHFSEKPLPPATPPPWIKQLCQHPGDALCALDAIAVETLKDDTPKFDMDYNKRLKKCRGFLSNSSTSRIGRGSQGFRYLHIPKTGGRNIETFLHLKHQSHKASIYKENEGARDSLITIRHPLERIQSAYHFMKGGSGSSSMLQRQAYLCVNGTGLSTNTECVPKISLFEFAMVDYPIFDAIHSDTGPWLFPTHSDSFGTIANFQSKWLISSGANTSNLPLDLKPPGAAGSLDDIKQHLLEKFALVGDTRELDQFKYMLARIWYGDTATQAKGRLCSSQKVINPSDHPSLLDELTEEQYMLCAKRHSADIRLYYWVVRQMQAQQKCFGLGNFPVEC